MATFTDQFARHDPLEFDVGDVYGGRLQDAVLSARVILWDRQASELSAIAREVDAVVHANAVQLGSQVAIELGAEDLLDAPTLQAHAELHAVAAREDEGVLRLYVYDNETGEGLGQPALPSGTNHEQALAVLALWMAADCLDSLQRSRDTALRSFWPDVSAPPVDAGEATARLRQFYAGQAVECAMDAVRANEMALAASSFRIWSARRELSAVSPMRGDDGSASAARQRHASEAARAAAAARWARKEGHMQEALVLAASRPFKSRRDAARFVVDRIEKAPGEFYSEETVDNWLKVSNWQSV